MAFDQVGYNVEEPRMAECPVSFITSESFELVRVVNSLMRGERAAGAGVPADRLPGKILDAINLCQLESDKAEAAMNDAVFMA